MQQAERTADDGGQDEARGIDDLELASIGWASPVVQTLPLTSGPSTWAPVAGLASGAGSLRTS